MLTTMPMPTTTVEAARADNGANDRADPMPHRCAGHCTTQGTTTGCRRPSARRLHRMALCLSLAAALSACGSLAPTRPSMPEPPPMPARFDEAVTSDPAPAADWWRGFGSPALDRLIDQALSANPDLAIAGERVRQAEAQLQVAGASLLPTVSASAGTNRNASRPQGGPLQSAAGSSLGVSASWEPDLWGGRAAGVDSARAALQGSQRDRDTAQLALVTALTQTYIDGLALRERIAIANDNLAIAQRVLAVVDARVRAGAASALDRTQQETAVLQQRAALPPLALLQRQTVSALALLAGQAPQGFEAGWSPDAALGTLQPPPVGAGLPSSLLLRRPDLAAAQARLAAANADVQAARAALLPSIQLTGSAGVSSAVLLNVLNSPTLAVGVGASLLQPLFDGGRLRGQVAVAESQQRALVIGYQQAVRAALADVDNALAASARNAEQLALQQQVQDRARESLRLAEARYRAGSSDLLSVLDAQRTLFQANDQAIQLQQARLQAAVGLVKALGGGWRAGA